ncbi:MAG TPA: ATP-binding protein [Thermoleophilaceae bacterium]|nr:ATP-binding protein [Thermoleophilaceae bacterium]
MRRLPIRLKLTLAFAGVMAVVLAATGLFLYLRLEAELDNTLDNGLRSRADDVSALVERAGSGLTNSGQSRLTEQVESFAQVLDSRGRVVDATPQLRDRPLLTRRELREAWAGTVTVERDSLLERGVTTRLLATPVDADGRPLVVVVGAALDDNEEALANLAWLLAIGGPIALVLASLAGYGVAAAALRPVEAMRAKASGISEHESGERLPVPESGDEVARLGETLNAMLDRLEVAFARERSFVSDASHELRSPLAILKTELELALRRDRTREELHESLRSAAEETDRLAGLAEDLLVIARSDRGRLPVRLAPVDAVGLVEGMEERFDRRVRAAGRRLVVHAPSALRLTADSLRLEQALGNLLDNALRHGEGEIRLEARAHDGRVELHVRDEGPGFPPPFIPEAFERFTRADPARTRGGAGLGLAIVQAIAVAHDGHAHAMNAPGGGADVWIELPGNGRVA